MGSGLPPLIRALIISASGLVLVSWLLALPRFMFFSFLWANGTLLDAPVPFALLPRMIIKISSSEHGDHCNPSPKYGLVFPMPPNNATDSGEECNPNDN